jgi:hypothetical protein
MSFRVVGAFIITAALAASAACTSSSPAPASTGGPRVYFSEPKDGAMVKSPVHIVFASDMYTIAPVPPGEVTQVRSGTGHYWSRVR